MNYRKIKQANAAYDTANQTAEELPFTNDWIFSMVMRDKDICRELLMRILPDEQFGAIHLADPDGTFSDTEQPDGQEPDNATPGLSSQIQAALKFGWENHGVRFDAYVKSEELWAEIEMQVYTGDHLGKRSRYYCANMDVDMLMAGADYKDLKKSYVIFICTYDYMERGEPIYFFQRFDVEKQLPFTDESYILILNTSCDPEKVPDNLKALYAYVNDPANTSDDALMEKIDGQVKKYNSSEWRWTQVTLEEHIKHIAYMARDEGRSEGREEGLTQGRREGKLEGLSEGDTCASRRIAAKLKAAGMAPADIAEATGLSPEEIEKL